VAGAFDAEHCGDLADQLGRRAQVFRPVGSADHAANPGGVGAGQTCDDGRIGCERDHVARRQLPVILGNREVLVHQAASLEEHEAHDLLLLDAEEEDDRAHPVGELARQPPEHLGIAVAELVVDGGPAVPGRGDRAALRAARQSRHELAHGSDDGVAVVRLHVHRPK
jgi:hypothetical protein